MACLYYLAFSLLLIINRLIPMVPLVPYFSGKSHQLLCCPGHICCGYVAACPQPTQMFLYSGHLPAAPCTGNSFPQLSRKFTCKIHPSPALGFCLAPLRTPLALSARVSLWLRRLPRASSKGGPRPGLGVPIQLSPGLAALHSLTEAWKQISI